MNYSQPTFYRFNEDSIILSKEVVPFVKDGNFVVDLCCGSGVVGIEMMILSKNDNVELLFIEKQIDFERHLKTNIECFLPQKIKASIAINSFENICLLHKADLIISNPPYYFKEDGKVSPDMKRANARSWDYKDFERFLNFFEEHLKPFGKGFFVGPHQLEKLSREYKFEVYKRYKNFNIYLFTLPLSPSS